MLWAGHYFKGVLDWSIILNSSSIDDNENTILSVLGNRVPTEYYKKRLIFEKCLVP